MITFIQALICFFAFLYAVVGLGEGNTSKGYIALIFTAMIIATEVLPC